MAKYSFIDSHYLLNMGKDPSQVSGAFMGSLFPLSLSSCSRCRKAMVRSLANPAIASSSLTDAGGFFHGIGEGRLLAFLGSEVGSELFGSCVADCVPLNGTFPPFLPERNVSWVPSIAFRSRPVSFR